MPQLETASHVSRIRARPELAKTRGQLRGQTCTIPFHCFSVVLALVVLYSGVLRRGQEARNDVFLFLCLFVLFFFFLREREGLI